jgi:hypothetical protein
MPSERLLPRVASWNFSSRSHAFLCQPPRIAPITGKPKSRTQRGLSLVPTTSSSVLSNYTTLGAAVIPKRSERSAFYDREPRSFAKKIRASFDLRSFVIARL